MNTTPASEPVFFLDWSICNRLVIAALRDHVAIELHGDHFAQNEFDTNWLAEVGRRGWVVITKDAMIRRRSEEIAAAYAANVGLFIFNSGNLPSQETAQAILTALSEMQRFAREQPRPFVAIVDRYGGVRLDSK